MPRHHLRGSMTHGDLSRLGFLHFAPWSASMATSRIGLLPRSFTVGKEQAGGAHLRCSQTTCHLFGSSERSTAMSAPLRSFSTLRKVSSAMTPLAEVRINFAFG